MASKQLLSNRVNLSVWSSTHEKLLRIAEIEKRKLTQVIDLLADGRMSQLGLTPKKRRAKA